MCDFPRDVEIWDQKPRIGVRCQGENMLRGCEIGDYTVTVGTVTLTNLQLTNNELTVKLISNIETYERGDLNGCRELYPVRVRMLAMQFCYLAAF